MIIGEVVKDPRVRFEAVTVLAVKLPVASNCVIKLFEVEAVTPSVEAFTAMAEFDDALKEGPARPTPGVRVPLAMPRFCRARVGLRISARFAPRCSIDE